MYKALYLSPMLQTSNAKETALFFQNVLQFKIVRDEQTYIILTKDNLSIHIKQVEENPDGMEFYLEVDDLDSLWSSIKDKLSGIKVREPFNQSYGMRETHIMVPYSNTIVFIGQWVG